MYEREITVRSNRSTQTRRQGRRRRRTRRSFGFLFPLALCTAVGILLWKGLIPLPIQAQDDAPGNGGDASSVSDGAAASHGAPSVPDASDASHVTPEEPALDGQVSHTILAVGPVPSQDPASSQEPVSSQGVIPAQEPNLAGGEAGEDDWHLVLVNPWNPIPEDYTFTLKQLDNGHAVDERCYPDLQEMMDACRAEGLSPIICSSYRTQEKQESLYQNKINRLIAQGYSEADAVVEAGKVVAVPGTSEHQLGLALDIVDVNNQNLDKSQEGTAVQQWLMAHSWEYGFILRYPNDKSDLTGIIYEPWHYRYVGREAAEEIYSQGVCLEEYLGAADAG